MLSDIAPSRAQSTLVAKKTKILSRKKVEQTIKINASAIVFPQPFQTAANPLKI